MNETALIATKGLTKAYGPFYRLARTEPGGPAGRGLRAARAQRSGKTTTIRLLLGLLRPTAGHATVVGFDCWRQSLQVRRLVSYLPGELRMYGSMSGLALLRFLCRPARGRRPRPGRGDLRAGDEAQPEARRSGPIRPA